MTRVTVDEDAYDSVQFARLTRSQTRKIHWASLEILERIGVRLHDQEAIDLLRKGGADVVDGDLVYVPAGMVEKAFSTAPERVVLHDRHGEPVMPVEGERCFYGPGSDTLNIVDHRTDERRKPVRQDVVEGAIVCDALPNVDFLMSMVLPTDVDQTRADRHQMQAMLTNSTKPIVCVAYEQQGLVDAVEMAEVVAGGADELRRRPSLTCYINVISGLNHNEEALAKLLFLSGKGLPSMYIPSTMAGVTSPITPVGAIALDNAGVLVGLVLSQLKHEGAPYIMPGMPPSPMDMSTMTAPYADPERGIFQSLARMYGLPAFGLGGASDAKVVDQQAGAEAALTLLAESLVGGNIIHDLGYLESGLTFSLAQLAICDDIVGWVGAFMRGVEVSDETLALDVIEAVGHEGDYLATEHTLEHFREIWYPQLFERQTYGSWQERGATTLAERAAARVDRILDEHRAEPLPEDATRRLAEIVERAGA